MWQTSAIAGHVLAPCVTLRPTTYALTLLVPIEPKKRNEMLRRLWHLQQSFLFNELDSLLLNFISGMSDDDSESETQYAQRASCQKVRPLLHLSVTLCTREFCIRYQAGVFYQAGAPLFMCTHGFCIGCRCTLISLHTWVLHQAGAPLSLCTREFCCCTKLKYRTITTVIAPNAGGLR